MNSAKRIVKAAVIVALLSAAHFALGFAAFVVVDVYNNDGRTTFIDAFAAVAVEVLWFPFRYLAKDAKGYLELAFFVANSLFWGVALFATWTTVVRKFGRRFSLSNLLALATVIAVAMWLMSAYFSAISD